MPEEGIASPRPTILVHIGCEKTGTSAIQQFLRANRQALAHEGVGVSELPGSPGHIALPAYAVDADPEGRDDVHASIGVTWRDQERFRERVRSQLAAELAAHPTVVISSEHLSSRVVDPDERQRLRELFDGLGSDVRVILYLRRPVDLIESRYSTAIKVGHTIRSLIPSHIEGSMLDYVALLDRWRADYGDALTVAVYREEWRQETGRLPRHFCALAGIPWSESLEVPERLENPSLGRGELELLRMLNLLARTEPGFDAGLPFSYFAYAEQRVRTPPYGMTTDERKRLWATWLEDQGALMEHLPASEWEYLAERPAAHEEPDDDTRDLERALALDTLIRVVRGSSG